MTTCPPRSSPASPKTGGRLLVLTGDNAFGGNTYAGLGAYYSDDDGKTWQHATGIPDGLLSFRLAVDPNDAQKVYAATGGGLFRSTDGGVSYTNVNLPTGDCARQAGPRSPAKDCFLANVVTDVTVQGEANAQTAGGQAGRRAGRGRLARRAPSPTPTASRSRRTTASTAPTTARPAPSRTSTWPGNSTADHRPAQPGAHRPHRPRRRDGRRPGPQRRLRDRPGRGEVQRRRHRARRQRERHDDAPRRATTSTPSRCPPTSARTGRSSRARRRSTTTPPATRRSRPPACKAPAVVAYCPGIQAWYNLWVAPDPTRQTATGVPTRLAFGLEEVWSGTDATGLDGTVPQKFGVVGRYYAGKLHAAPATNGAAHLPDGRGRRSCRRTRPTPTSTARCGFRTAAAA